MTTHFLRIVTVTVLSLFIFFSTGCSSQAWFEGFKMGAQHQCMQYMNDDEVQACLQQVDAMQYEDYREQYEQSRRQ